MLTSIGLALLTLGGLGVRAWGSTLKPYSYNRVDYIGGGMAMVGGACLLLSACILCWRYLP